MFTSWRIFPSRMVLGEKSIMRESDFLKKELNTIQEEYRTLVYKGSAYLDLNNYQLHNCLFFIDEVKRFWLEKKELLRYCWDRITEHEDCFILSAAIYLQVDSCNQYSFKAVGDYHLLPDPFIKMEIFLRATGSFVESEEIEKQFRSVVKDTVIILKDYASDFIFVDVSVIGAPPQDDRMETIHNGYVNFIAQAFQVEEIDTLEAKLLTYEQIEEALPSTMLNLLIFSDSDDVNLRLGDRVENFLEHQKQISSRHLPENAFGKFSFAVFCIYSQAVDTILNCIPSGIYPFFRSDVPVKYFYMLTTGYAEDGPKLEFIWKAIVGYFIGKEIEQLELTKVPFDNYAAYLKAEAPFAKIVSSLQLDSSEVSNCTINEVAKAVKPVMNRLKIDLCV